MSPDASFNHHPGDLVRLGQGLEGAPAHELHDQLVRRLLGLEALLNTDQKVLGAFLRDLKSGRDDLEGLVLMCFFGHDQNCTPRSSDLVSKIAVMLAFRFSLG